jgi:hypothetical protein
MTRRFNNDPINGDMRTMEGVVATWIEGVWMTRLEQDMLAGLYESDYANGESRPSIYAWQFNCTLATAKQTPALIRSLVKKGVLETGGRNHLIGATEKGEAVAIYLGLCNLSSHVRSPRGRLV